MSNHNTRTSRRGLLLLGAAGAAARSQAAAPGKLLKDGDRVHVGGRGPQMIDRARSLGREYLEKCGNCAQATIAALQDALEFAPKQEHVFLAGTCLAAGATATGNANCGGFTGSGIVIGSLCGRPRGQFADSAATRVSGRLIREVAGRFDQTYGCVLCKDVRARASKKCSDVVANAAGWAAEAILKQFAG